MHMWQASTTTPTPDGATASHTALATSRVSRSWTWVIMVRRPVYRGQADLQPPAVHLHDPRQLAQPQHLAPGQVADTGLEI